MVEKDPGSLVDSNTVSKNDVTSPEKILDVKANLDTVSSMADKLASKNDLAAKTNRRDSHS